ncbi:DMT family transporter [Pseudothioclava arenosa]|uniref:EamA family transporter n=1 Tax=Pseudothioclava arenosa TaxID=1795308 RepID=A0A2A4CTB6_9RHOB|nr:DMT family transporter [Pseudothioclava arenosa]PCD77528.1 EamA family transporter [Pseudothioclava arenosa]
MNDQDRILPGIALMLFFCASAPLIDVASKLAAQEVAVGTVTLGRYLMQGLLMAPVALLLGHSLAVPLSGRLLWLGLARAGFSVLATFSFVAAVRLMPIADALAIAFVEPFIILLIGRFFMGEEVGPRRLGAAVVGFIGALFVIQPSFSEFGTVALFPLGTALFFALYMMITRRLSREVHPIPMQFQTAVYGVLICLPFLALGGSLGAEQVRFDLPQGIFWIWCAGVGLASTISHISMSYALKFAPSSTLAPLHYFEMITATLFGYLVFRDFPNLSSWIGIAIITGSGLYLIHRERVTARDRKVRRADALSQAGQAPILPPEA